MHFVYDSAYIFASFKSLNDIMTVLTFLPLLNH